MINVADAPVTAQESEDLQDTLAIRAASVYKAQTDFFRSGSTRPFEFRRRQLKRLMEGIQRNEGLVIEALHKDLRKSEFEAFGTEIGILYKEIRHTIKNLRSWMSPKKVPTPVLLFPSTSRIIPDPLGVVFIIGPWNYPFHLAINPLIGAIAGGNTAFVKPSEQAPHTAAAVEKILSETFEEDYVAVFQGPGHVVAPALIETCRFDHIFFTGNPAAGRNIMELAARDLTPVTLELGGKSPCIIDRSADLEQAARKVAWSKLINAGQTCVAPDYVLVHAEVRDRFLEKLKSNFARMLGDDAGKSPDYGRMINRKRFDVVSGYIRNGRVLHGGGTDPDDLFIEPTILDGVSAEDKVMNDEIFGPVLPLITYRDRNEVLEWIERNPYPLALYLFANDSETEDFYIERVRFGGGCVNNAILHLANHDLPFGGVGTSGIGQYHGKHGFDVFTRPKSVVRSPSWFDVPLTYPPYRDNLKWLRMFFKL